MNGDVVVTSRDDHAEELRNITQCSVCRGRFMDPRVLPCLHTFCLDCIQHAGVNRSPGDQMSCPLCRKEFTIPDGDFDGLQKDFRLRTLLELSCASFGFKECGPEDMTDEMMKLETVFCLDCQMAISVREHFNCHRSHNCEDVVTAIKLLRDRVDKAERKVLDWKAEIHGRHQELEAVRAEFNRELSQSKRTVRKRGGELRVLVETHIRALESELERLEEGTTGELDAEEEALDLQLVNIRRFVSRCEKLKLSKGNSLPSDLCRSAIELCAEAENVGKRRMKICRERNSSRSVKVRLKTTQLEEFLAASSNSFVGTLQTMRHPSPRSNVSTRTASGSIWRILRLLDVRILVSGAIGLAAGLSVMAGFNTAAGIVVGLLATLTIFAVLYPLLPKTNSLRLVTSYRRHNRHSCGVTHLRHRIYVLLQSPASIVVFSDASPSFLQLEEIPLLPQVLVPCDVASCHVTDRLYVSDSGTRCLWKLDLAEAGSSGQHPVSCWIRDLEKPYTVSVSADGRIVAVREERPHSTVSVYAPDGVRIASVRLPASVTQPYHCVETSTGTYVVSHGTWISHTHGLIEVDGAGLVLAAYNSTECLWGILKAITLLIDPSLRQDDARHLAVDYNDRVFVADWFNDRIMQFDPGFRRHRMHVTSAASGLGWPIIRLCYAKEKRQMLVVHETAKENKVNVYLMH